MIMVTVGEKRASIQQLLEPPGELTPPPFEVILPQLVDGDEDQQVWLPGLDRRRA